MGPTCPNCKGSVPFGRTQWGLGKTFQCKGCGQALVIPKSLSSIGIALFIAFWTLRDRAEGVLETLALISALVVAGLIASWLFAKPQVPAQ